MAPSLTVNCTLTLPESAIGMINAVMDKARCNTIYGMVTPTTEYKDRCTTEDKECCNTTYGMIASEYYNRKG